MGKVSVDGININYQEGGTGFPLVLLHGLSDSSALWAPLMPEFSRHYRTIAMDLRGHGYSDKTDMPYSIRLFSEDLLGFLQELEIPQAHLLGLSMGGAIAQQFALDHPERVCSLILLSTLSYCDPDVQNTLRGIRERVVNGGLPAFFDEAINLVVTPEFVSTNANAIAEMKKECVRINSPAAIVHAIDACMDFDVKDRISQLSHPTLIISGREDAFCPIYLAERIHRSIKSSEWKIMEGVGHNLLIPEKIRELTQIVLGFLERH